MENKNDKMGLKGFLKISQIDKNGNIIETSYYNNIMDSARINILKYLRGEENSLVPIGKFVMGTDGVDGSGTPKTFPTTRTNTFSEENGTEFYYITWKKDTNGNIIITSEEGNPSTNSTVSVTPNDSSFQETWTFDIPYGNANGSGTRAYSEVALYINDGNINDIFSMKTFPVRTKDSTVELKIEWTIQLG